MMPYVRKLLLVIAFVAAALLWACIRTPLPPVAVIQCVQVSPLEFEVSAAQSYDPDGEIGLYSWDFGDGSISSACTATHRYEDAGEFTIRLTVMDNSGFQTSKLEHVLAGYELEVGKSGAKYATIQEAIEASEDGDFISVLSGTYAENLDFLGKAISVKARVPGSATIQAIEEVSEGALPAVRFHSGESRDSVLDGFIIQGLGPLGATPDSGAGINVSNASPTIRNCTIQNGSAMEGAGVYAYESNMLLENCQISQCSATINGGGILMIGKAVFPEIRSCSITSNRADAGGGIYIHAHGAELAENAVLPLISNCTIMNNTASGSSGMVLANRVGGGIEVGTGCRYIGEGNTIVDNAPCDVAYHDTEI